MYVFIGSLLHKISCFIYSLMQKPVRMLMAERDNENEPGCSRGRGQACGRQRGCGRGQLGKPAITKVKL